MSHHLIWCACGLTVILALCAPGGHGLHTSARGLPGPARSPVLATVRVGPNPVALAVDPRSRHVLVVNGGIQADADRVLIGPGSVSLLDATTGAVLRTVPAGRGLGAIAVDAQTQRAFVLGRTTVSVLNTHSGAVLRRVTPSTKPRALAVDAPRHQVFVATAGARTYYIHPRPPTLVVLDAASGALRRTLSSLPVAGYAVAVDGRAGRVYVATGGVATLNARTGRLLNLGPLPGVADGVIPTIYALGVDEVAGGVVVQYGDGRGGSYVALLDARTGRVRATPSAFGAGGSVGTIAVDLRTSRAFVATVAAGYEAEHGTPYGVVSVVDTRRGRVVANVTVANVQGGAPYPAGLAVDTRRGHVYVVTTPDDTHSTQPLRSTLSVLDARSGHLLRTLTLPRVALPAVVFSYPAIYPAMAVDGQTGRLFIANGGDNSVSVLGTARL